MNNNITPGHVTAFQVERFYENVTLTSCTVDDEPGVAIVAVQHGGGNTVEVMPLFVAITRNMKIELPGEDDSDGDGGPKNPRDDAKKEVTLPWRYAPRR